MGSEAQQLVERMLDIQLKSVEALRELENKMIAFGYLEKQPVPRGLMQMVRDLKKRDGSEEEECKYSEHLMPAEYNMEGVIQSFQEMRERVEKMMKDLVEQTR